MPLPHLITHDGKTLTRQEWSDRLGIPVNTIAWRQRKGMPPAVILSTCRLPMASRETMKDRSKPDLASAERVRPRHSRAPHADPYPIGGRNSVHNRPRGLKVRFAERTFITFNDETRSIAEWAFILKLSEGTIIYRLGAGKPTDEVLRPPSVSEPARKVSRSRYARQSMLTFNGRTMTVEGWAQFMAVPFVDLLRKLNAGEPLEACLTAKRRPQHVRAKTPQASPARPRMRVPTLAELDAVREAA